MYGCMAYGSQTIGVPVTVADQVMPYRVIVNGADHQIVMDGSVEITDVTEGRSTCKFTLSDEAKTIYSTPGESVYITWYGVRIFGGTVEKVDESAPDTEATIFHKFYAVDFAELADRYLVNNRYVGQTVRQIITDIVNVQTGLALDGVTLADVQEGPVIDVISFSYKKASDCFREITDTVGMGWNINAFRVMQVFDRATYAAPFSVGDLNPIHREFSLKLSRSRYRNRQFLRAGKDKTDWMVDNIRGSSAAPEAGGSPDTPAKRTRTFLLRYDLAELFPTSGAAPGNLHILREGVQQRVGIKGVDEDGDLTITDWCQWFVEYGAKEISQNSEENETDNPTLMPDQILEVKYKGYFPIIVDSEASEEISARQAIEGGSGEYQEVEDDEKIDGREFAMAKADSLMARYGRIPNEISYGTDEPGLMAGQLQTNRFALHGLPDIQYLIREVHMRILHGPVLRCTVKALDGERQDGWADFFRQQWQAGRKFVIRENEKLNISKSPKDVLVFTDTLTESVHDSVTLDLWTEDPFTWAILGFLQDDVYAYPEPGCVIGRSIMGVPYGS